jgi:general secretion pathway protein H
VFKAREVPDSIEFELVVEGRGADLVPTASERRRDPAPNDDDAEREDREAPRQQASTVTPQVLVLASGELTPFTLMIESDDARQRWVMTGQPYGAIELKEEEGF